MVPTQQTEVDSKLRCLSYKFFRARISDILMSEFSETVDSGQFLKALGLELDFSKQQSFSPLNPGSNDIKMSLNGFVIFELWQKNRTGFAFDSFEKLA